MTQASVEKLVDTGPGKQQKMALMPQSKHLVSRESGARASRGRDELQSNGKQVLKKKENKQKDPH